MVGHTQVSHVKIAMSEFHVLFREMLCNSLCRFFFKKHIKDELSFGFDPIEKPVL